MKDYIVQLHYSGMVEYHISAKDKVAAEEFAMEQFRMTTPDKIFHGLNKEILTYVLTKKKK